MERLSSIEAEVMQEESSLAVEEESSSEIQEASSLAEGTSLYRTMALSASVMEQWYDEAQVLVRRRNQW